MSAPYRPPILTLQTTSACPGRRWSGLQSVGQPRPDCRFSALGPRAVFEAAGFVSGLNNLSKMVQSVQERLCRLAVVENNWPFAEGSDCGDKYLGLLAEPGN